MDMTKLEKLKPFALFGVGVIVGGVGAYLSTKNYYRRLADAEIEDVKLNYRAVRKEDVQSPAELAASKIPGNMTEEEYLAARELAARIVQGEGYDPDELVDLEDTDIRVNAVDVETTEKMTKKTIFSQSVELSPEEEAQGVPPEFFSVRDPENPYVISLAEFEDNEEGFFEEINLTYYAEDGVLCTINDMQVEDVEGTVGSASLEKFGVGSKNDALVYVRNERLKVDFEITQVEGSYEEHVLGIRPEKPRKVTKKMRPEDD